MAKQTVNKVFIMGTLGRDPELRYTSGSKAVCSLSVATNDGAKGATTNWHKVTVWDKQAENCKEYLQKGSEVWVEGYVNYRSYDKNGTKVYVTDIVAREVKFLSSKSSDGVETAKPQQTTDDTSSVDEDPPF